MAYQIKYNLVGPNRRTAKKSKRVLVIVTALGISCLVITALHLPWAQNLLLPGDSAVTAAALEDLADNLQQGESFMDAITAFCRNIIANGT